ncbi:TetR/AcrR family transcriptional regulator [Lysinibacter cavernae]|uniref:AcrR family transcriptional regulator n=1 Tax=Lysinibacter cavernae TaxID=1640652 RepID=A0A7X5R3I1_9MICO|nr:TetR/AcrR family transcriptional regulator [Lysinibacter cavernae]NIH55005.1 AcrR family transcriptional regulator [Lysinibacter cavernae]
MIDSASHQPDSPRKRPKREDVRSRLLDSAMRVFTEVGYQAARLDVIAERAGFTKGALYSNFASKQELFATLLGERLSAAAADLLAEAGAQRSLNEAVDHAARRLAHEVLHEQSWHALVTEFTLLAARDPEVGLVFRELRRDRRSLFADGLARAAAPFGGSADPNEYLAISLVILSTINGLSAELAADPGALSEADVVSGLSAVLTAALVPAT